MLRIANLSVSIGAVAILRDVMLELEEGEMCGLIGRNGAGKTTLMRALMGALPASGTAEFGGVDLLRQPAHGRVAHGIGYMPEDRRLVPEFTVEENIRLPSWATKLSGVDARLDWIFTIMPEVARFRTRRASNSPAGSRRWWPGACADGGPAHAPAERAVRRARAGAGAATRRSVGQPQGAGGFGLARESNEVHVADLLARAYRIERGAVRKE